MLWVKATMAGYNRLINVNLGECSGVYVLETPLMSALNEILDWVSTKKGIQHISIPNSAIEYIKCGSTFDYIKKLTLRLDKGHPDLSENFLRMIQFSIITDISLSYDFNRLKVQDPISVAAAIHAIDDWTRHPRLDTKTRYARLSYMLRVNQKQRNYYKEARMCLCRVFNTLGKHCVNKDIRRKIYKLVLVSKFYEIAAQKTPYTSKAAKLTVKNYNEMLDNYQINLELIREIKKDEKILTRLPKQIKQKRDRQNTVVAKMNACGGELKRLKK